MDDVKFKQLLQDKEIRKKIAEHMFCPIRCGGAGYDENGKYYLILVGKRRNAKEVNQIIREMNPKYTDEQLQHHFLDESK